MRKLITTALVALGLVIGVTGTANAGTSSDGLLVASDASSAGSGCTEARYAFNPLTWYVNGWQAEITITAPNGTVAGSDFLYDGVTTGSTLLCTYADAPGTYTIRADWTGYDYDYSAESGSSTSTFTYPKASAVGSKITLTTRPAASPTKVKYIGTLYRGSQRWANHKVLAQCKVLGAWRNIHSARSHANGQVIVTVPKGHGAACRLHSQGNATTRSANSRTFWMGGL